MKQFLKSYNTLRFIWRKMSSRDNLVAVCQMTARNDKSENVKSCKKLIVEASEQGAKVVFLPEACDYIGENKAEILKFAEPLDGNLVNEYRDLAKTCNVWISLGGVHEKVSEEKVRNSHIVINNTGEIVAVYRKTHLFDVELPEKNIRLKESDYVEPGKEIVPPVTSPIGNIGLGICYDMRFPELGIVLREMGADILTYPSAFTQSTGAVHWEVLLRARAIETQCYVIAAAQTGVHNIKRSSWGHAMIVDPWGTVIAQCPEGTNFVMAAIDHSLLKKVKVQMPVWNHRRYDLYPKLLVEKKFDKQMSKAPYQFGKSMIKGEQIFLETLYTIAFTNKRCVLPGHVLVAPKRCVKRMHDLSSDEVKDLFLAVTSVQKIVERCYSSNSSTICVQDGVDAGQTIEHVHVHVIPRKHGDFTKNDDIYVALEKHDKEGKDREESDMFKEALILRQLIL